MERRRRSARTAATTVVGIVIVASLFASAHGQAAPEGDATPGAVSCSVGPLTTPVWDGTELREPTAPVSIDGPFVPPTGEAVDDATRDGVTATISESIACQNDGDLARTLALFTPRGVAAFFSGPRGYDAGDVDATIAASPQPVSDDRRIDLVAVDDVVQLNRQLVGATVTSAAGEQQYVDFVYLAEGTTPDGQQRWLIDSSIAIDAQTQVEGGATVIP